MPLKTLTWIGILLGFAGLGLLVAWQGAAAVAGHFRAADWTILVIVVFALPELLFSAWSWQFLFLRGRAPGFRDAVSVTWMGTSVNLLLPGAAFGGEFVKARQAIARGTPALDAVASVILDKTVQAIAIVLWTLIGLAVLIALDPGGELVAVVIAGAALLSFGIAGFIVVQCAGAFGFLARSANRFRGRDRWRALVEGAHGLDGLLRALYGRPGAITLASLIRLASRVVMIGEVWIAAQLMGLPIGLAEAVVLKSLTMALRSAVFVIPGGLGVQEGAYVVLGAVIGLPPDAMLSISLATRLRELLMAVPGLLHWQLSEGRLLLAQRGREPG